MSKFHSMVSRRDFMKGLGLSTAGLGAAAAVMPVYHDLDELIAAPAASWDRAWYIKEVDKPTVEIDWNMMQRHDGRYHGNSKEVRKVYIGGAEIDKLTAEAADIAKKATQSAAPGNTHPDQALQDASAATFGSPFSWLGAQKVKTPEQRGCPKYQGTPEENTRMLRAAMRFFGATQISVAELNEDHKKLIFTHNRQGSLVDWQSPKWPPPVTGGRAIVFENVDAGYETPTKFVIPDRQMSIVAVGVPMSTELFRTQPHSCLGGAGNTSRYRLWSVIHRCTQEFLRGLGYQGLGGAGGDTQGVVGSPGDAIVSGFGEMSRNSQACIDPEYGPVVGTFSELTSLPLAPTKPINAGIFRFCHTCKKCYDNCPATPKALSGDGLPTWEVTELNGKPNLLNEPGKRVFWSDIMSCARFYEQGIGGCSSCYGVCVFNVGNSAFIHNVVKATVSTSSLFNSFFRQAHDFFGYELIKEEDKDNWWNMSLPAYGFDSTLCSSAGGYNK